MNEHSTSVTVNCDIDELKRLATEFRFAIEKCESISTIIITFREFPRASCGEASLLLAKYLEQNGCGGFDYVLGERDSRSHAWLQQGNTIIDITGDQFNDNHQPVIVTQDSAWHSQFNGKIQHTADIDKYDERFKAIAWAGYNVIVQTLNTTVRRKAK